PDALVLADTIGVASPRAVTSLTERVAALGRPVGGHFHNTRNTGYANALAALESGASILDASIAGLGGCAFAPNATGNIATDDLVYLLDREGVETGIDIDRLIATSEWLSGLLGRRLEGQLYRAGAFPPSAEQRAGRIVRRTSASSRSPARPRSTTSSSSTRNVLVDPSASP